MSDEESDTYVDVKVDVDVRKLERAIEARAAERAASYPTLHARPAARSEPSIAAAVPDVKHPHLLCAILAFCLTVMVDMWLNALAPSFAIMMYPVSVPITWWVGQHMIGFLGYAFFACLLAPSLPSLRFAPVPAVFLIVGLIFELRRLLADRFPVDPILYTAGVGRGVNYAAWLLGLIELLIVNQAAKERT